MGSLKKAILKLSLSRVTLFREYRQPVVACKMGVDERQLLAALALHAQPLLLKNSNTILD